MRNNQRSSNEENYKMLKNEETELTRSLQKNMRISKMITQAGGERGKLSIP